MLSSFSLTNPRRTNKEETTNLSTRLVQTNPVTTNGTGNLVHCLGLTNNMFVKLLIKVAKLIFFLLLQVTNWNICPFFNDSLHILNGNSCRIFSMVFFGFLLCLFKLSNLIAVESCFFIVLVISCLLLVCFSCVDFIFNCVWIHIFKR